MTTFEPARSPEIGNVSREVNTRVLLAPFGDGYTQRAGDGLNAIGRSVSLSWQSLLTAEADAIDAFLEAQRGYLAFDWADPREGVTRKWTCKSWTRSFGAGKDSITATFVQEFDL